MKSNILTLGTIRDYILEYFPETKWKKARVVVGGFTKNKIEIGGDSKWQNQ